MCKKVLFLPAEDSEYEIEHEEGTDDDQRHEVELIERVPDGVVRLHKKILCGIYVSNATERPWGILTYIFGGGFV